MSDVIWSVGSGVSYGSIAVTPSQPIDCRWHLVQDQWCLVQEDDGEVLARVYEERGIWCVAVDDCPIDRYIGLTQAKTRAEDAVGPVNIIQSTRQNSAGIP